MHAAVRLLLQLNSILRRLLLNRGGKIIYGSQHLVAKIMQTSISG